MWFQQQTPVACHLLIPLADPFADPTCERSNRSHARQSVDRRPISQRSGERGYIEIGLRKASRLAHPGNGF